MLSFEVVVHGPGLFHPRAVLLAAVEGTVVVVPDTEMPEILTEFAVCPAPITRYELPTVSGTSADKIPPELLYCDVRLEADALAVSVVPETETTLALTLPKPSQSTAKNEEDVQGAIRNQQSPPALPVPAEVMVSAVPSVTVVPDTVAAITVPSRLAAT